MALPPAGPPLSYPDWITLMQEYPGTLLGQAGLFTDPTLLQTLAESTTFALHHSQGTTVVPTATVISQPGQQQRLLQPSLETYTPVSVEDWVEDVSWPGSLTEEVNVDLPSTNLDWENGDNILGDSDIPELGDRHNWDDNKRALVLSTEGDTHPMLSYEDVNESNYDAHSSSVDDTGSLFTFPSLPGPTRHQPMKSAIQPQDTRLRDSPEQEFIEDSDDSVVELKEEVKSEPEYVSTTQTTADPASDGANEPEDSTDQLSSDEYKDDPGSSKSKSAQTDSSSDSDFTPQSTRAYRFQRTVAHQKRKQEQHPGCTTTKRCRTRRPNVEQDLLIHERAANAALRDTSEKRTRSQTGYEPHVTNYLKRLFFEVYVKAHRCKLSKTQREAAATFTHLLPRRITYWFSNRRRRLTQARLDAYHALCQNGTINSFEEYVAYLQREQRETRQKHRPAAHEEEHTGGGGAQKQSHTGRSLRSCGRGRGRRRQLPT